VTRRFINELQSGDRIEDQVFLVQSKDLRTTTQGGLYIHAVLADRTGQILARHWQATESLFQMLTESDYVRFKGRVENYKGNPQFIVDGMQPADPGSFDIADFLPTTKNDIGEMWTRVLEILKGIKHPDLAALLQEFLADEELMAGFRRSPAAVTMHHAYIGGLMEHTLQLMELACRAIPLYPKLSLDLVLVGLFLHDIGKAKELSYDTKIGYSDEGQLVGHIAQAVCWIDQKTNAVGERTGKPFPLNLKFVLQHIVLSHHGQYLFGSPKLPAIPEAAAIHFLDNLDAKVNMMLSEIEKDVDQHNSWTNYVRALETKVYKPNVMGTQTG
jgi:3'-5' exoribonuclease